MNLEVMAIYMLKQHGLLNSGYMRCRPIQKWSKEDGVLKENYRTPYHLTRNELKKKLCDDGPDGCGPHCENWNVCMYGHAWVEGA